MKPHLLSASLARNAGAACLAAFLPMGSYATTTNAYDNADPYGLNHSWSVNNGGFGYGAWAGLGGVTGGGTYMEGSGAQVDGTYSFGLYAGGSAGSGSGIAVSRGLLTNLDSGEFSINTRFNLATTPATFSLRSTNSTASFPGGELLSFGLGTVTNGNTTNYVLAYTDSTGLHTLASGEARGPVWRWRMYFNATAGIYKLHVANLSNPAGFSNLVSGGLQQSNTTVGSFAALNGSSGDFQNLIFDSPTFTVVPTNPPSPVFQSVSKVPGSFGTHFLTAAVQTAPWSTYQTQYRTNLSQTNWIDLNAPFTALDSSFFWNDQIGSDATRFYRLFVLPQ